MPGKSPWSRRAVKQATGVAQGAAFVIHTDTQGNADANCTGVKDGEDVMPSYQAV